MTTREPRTDWTDLANDIRRVDGNHDLGAGALAEALIERGWTKAAPPPAEAVRAALKRLVATSDYEDGSGRALEDPSYDGCGFCGEYDLPHEVGEVVRLARALLAAPPAEPQP